MAKQRAEGRAREGGTGGGTRASAAPDADGHVSRAQLGMMAQLLAAEMRRGVNVGPQFFETRRGQQFYEVTMPRLVQQVTRLADAMEVVGRQLVENQGRDAAAGRAGRGAK